MVIGIFGFGANVDPEASAGVEAQDASSSVNKTSENKRANGVMSFPS